MGDQNLIADLIRAGTDPDLVQRVSDEIARLSAAAGDLERRRLLDRERQQKRRHVTDFSLGNAKRPRGRPRKNTSNSADLENNKILSRESRDGISKKGPPDPLKETTPNPSAKASGLGAPAGPSDPIEVLWSEGLEAMLEMGASEAKARSNIGRWLKQTNGNADLVLGAIHRANEHGTKDPIPLVGRILNPVNGNGYARGPPRQQHRDGYAAWNDWAEGRTDEPPDHDQHRSTGSANGAGPHPRHANGSDLFGPGERGAETGRVVHLRPDRAVGR